MIRCTRQCPEEQPDKTCAPLALDGEDFDNLNVYNRVHIRRIQLEVAARYSGKAHGNMREEHQLRRERIRKAKMFAASAVAIQRVFRGHRARNDIQLTREIRRVELAKQRHEAAVIARSPWWMERELPYTLPPIKTFGRKRDYLSSSGWGHWEGKKWVPALPPTSSSSSAQKKTFFDTTEIAFGDTHPTRIYTEQLKLSGHDKRRLQMFHGQPLDIYMPKPVGDSGL